MGYAVKLQSAGDTSFYVQDYVSHRSSPSMFFLKPKHIKKLNAHVGVSYSWHGSYQANCRISAIYSDTIPATTASLWTALYTSPTRTNSQSGVAWWDVVLDVSEYNYVAAYATVNGGNAYSYAIVEYTKNS